VSATAANPLSVRFIHGIDKVDGERWNALAGTAYPFLRHEFLLALESSACVSADTGWQPLHALVEQAGDGGAPALVGCMPLYAKTNSMGEYVFDWSWADAYTRHGLDYYPKLLTAIPFTPCTGPRLCIAPGTALATLLSVLQEGVKTLATRLEASSWHVLFPEEELRSALNAAGLLQRTGCQYQWFNNGYRDFEHFLETFSSRKRKNLRKERTRVAAQGITFEVLEGAAISAAHWECFFRFYQSTYFVRGRAPYLNQAFFRRIGRSMPEQLLLVLACKDGDYKAGALYFKGKDTLYGRYWGCTEEFQFLHFETCYYQGIDYCIRHGIARIDSGAQGEHKIQRGFKPVHTWSCHWIRHPDFAQAIARFLREEEQYISDYVARAQDYLPFRKDLEL
jgi:hypothetical protein